MNSSIDAIVSSWLSVEKVGGGPAWVAAADLPTSFTLSAPSCSLSELVLFLDNNFLISDMSSLRLSISTIAASTFPLVEDNS